MIIPEAIEDKTTHKWCNKGATKTINRKNTDSKMGFSCNFFLILCTVKKEKQSLPHSIMKDGDYLSHIAIK